MVHCGFVGPLPLLLLRGSSLSLASSTALGPGVGLGDEECDGRRHRPQVPEGALERTRTTAARKATEWNLKEVYTTHPERPRRLSLIVPQTHHGDPLPDSAVVPSSSGCTEDADHRVPRFRVPEANGGNPRA